MKMNLLEEAGPPVAALRAASRLTIRRETRRGFRTSLGRGQPLHLGNQKERTLRARLTRPVRRQTRVTALQCRQQGREYKSWSGRSRQRFFQSSGTGAPERRWVRQTSRNRLSSTSSAASAGCGWRSKAQGAGACEALFAMALEIYYEDENGERWVWPCKSLAEAKEFVKQLKQFCCVPVHVG